MTDQHVTSTSRTQHMCNSLSLHDTLRFEIITTGFPHKLEMKGTTCGYVVDKLVIVVF